jgi:hypothetical protein
MNGLFYDETGDFVTDLFYELDVVNDVEFAALGVPGSAKWIKSGVGPEIYVPFVYLGPEYDISHKCKLNPRHETEREIISCSCEIFGKDTLTDFVPIVGLGLIVIARDTFAKRLLDKKFCGLMSRNIEITENQSAIIDPKLVWLQSSRCDLFRRQAKPRLDGPNVCPFCDWGPVVCPECGDISYDCERCKERILVPEKQHQGAGDKRWIIKSRSAPESILEGKHWNGNDFIMSRGWHYISKRVVDWLLRVHAAPFIAKPARVDVTGMSPEQRAKLDAITKLE